MFDAIRYCIILGTCKIYNTFLKENMFNLVKLLILKFNGHSIFVDLLNQWMMILSITSLLSHIELLWCTSSFDFSRNVSINEETVHLPVTITKNEYRCTYKKKHLTFLYFITKRLNSWHTSTYICMYVPTL